MGMCILDLSKTLMYDFHYNYIKKKYNNSARLLFTDTDSLTYEIEVEDIYKDFWNDKDMFDNSDYPESSPYYCNVNKKIIGKSRTKLVASRSPNSLVLSLRCILMSKIMKKVEGLLKKVIKNNIKHEDYKNTLINNEQMHHKMKTIGS